MSQRPKTLEERWELEREAAAKDREVERKRELRRKQYEYEDEEEVAMLMATSKSLFTCPECGRSFKKPKHLQVHLVSHERQRGIAHAEQLAEHKKADEQVENARRSAAMAEQEHIRLQEMAARKAEEK